MSEDCGRCAEIRQVVRSESVQKQTHDVGAAERVWRRHGGRTVTFRADTWRIADIEANASHVVDVIAA